VYTGEFLKDYSIAIKGEWIAYVGDEPGESIGPDTEIIDARGKTVIPGLIDSHIHLADSKYSPEEFLKFAIPGGTTTVITEAIEPYPITGYEGIEDLLNSLKDQPIKIFATIPTMVSTSRNVDIPSGANLKRLLSRDDVLGLGESYWQAILNNHERFMPNFMETLQSGKRLEGHSAGAKGKKLMAYIATGISSCHEPINKDEVLERLRLGLYVMLREGSVRRDLSSISGIKDEGIDLTRLILVTDSIDPTDLAEKGHMQYVVQRAIDLGFRPANAVQMATLNAAVYFGLDGITGGVAPGKQGDMLILPDPITIKPECVISKGKVIARYGKLLASPKKYSFSTKTLNSVILPREFKASDFSITIEEKRDQVKVRVIDQITSLVTKEYIASLPVTEGEIRPDVGKDILKVAAIDRGKVPGRSFTGFVRGFRLKNGAIASSSAWDTSDIIAVGANDNDMAVAVNRIRYLQGGSVVCVDGRILSEMPLPIFGLMSNLSMKDILKILKEIKGIIKELGFPFDDPLLTLATLTGAAIPFIRICEDGLVNIKEDRILDLIVE
jgi:adenine deaminase